MSHEFELFIMLAIAITGLWRLDESGTSSWLTPLLGAIFSTTMIVMLLREVFLLALVYLEEIETLENYL